MAESDDDASDIIDEDMNNAGEDDDENKGTDGFSNVLSKILYQNIGEKVRIYNSLF